MKKSSILILCTLLLTLSYCTESADTRPPEARVKEVLDDYVKAWKAGDVDMMSKIWANDEDVVVIGTDAPERLIGWETLHKTYVKLFDIMKDTDIAVRNQKIKVSKSGTVAWYSQNITMNFIANGQPASVPNIRLTGVLEKRNNHWVLVQNHSSLPVEEDVIEY